MTKQKLIFSLSLMVLLYGCADEFTKPNDRKYQVSPEGSITLNLDQTFQEMDHFGASGGFQDQWVGQWPDATRNQVAEWFFSTENDDLGNPKGIGLSLWRTIIGDGAADQAYSGFPASNWYRETECYLDATAKYDWTKQAGERWFMTRAKEYGVSKFTA